jgi:hypothetical protein
MGNILAENIKLYLTHLPHTLPFSLHIWLRNFILDDDWVNDAGAAVNRELHSRTKGPIHLKEHRSVLSIILHQPSWEMGV